MVRLIVRIAAVALLDATLLDAAAVAGDAERVREAQVREAQVREAILRGDHIAVRCEGSLLDFVLRRMAYQPVAPDTPSRGAMAHREAVMFAAFLQESNPSAFARMLQAIRDGRPFAEVAQASYGVSENALWEEFVEGLKTQ